MRRPVWILVALGLVVAAVVALRRAQGRATAEDNAALIAAEERIQSLAHALIGAQVDALAGQDGAVAEVAAERLWWSGFPLERGPEGPVRPGFSEARWSIGAVVEGQGADFARDLRRFLDGFTAVEDLRLKLGDARAQDGGRRVEGKLKLRVVGRAPDGRREWVRGLGEVVAIDEGEGWRITELVMTEATSLLAARDPFVDVSGACGFGAAGVVVDPNQVPSDPAANNGGVAVADVDGDGFQDVLVTGRARNLLLMNRGGRFEPASGDGVAPVHGTAAQVALFLDHDLDGDQDLFLCTWDKRFVLLERVGSAQEPRFVDASERLGASPALLGNSLAAADVNHDGRPDVFVGVWSEIERTPLAGGTGPHDDGRPNLLFVSEGERGYREAAEAWGIRGARWSHASQFADVDGDRRPDLYVANDYSGGNRLYLHRGTAFEDAAEARGVLDRGWAMGVSFADVDADGDLDLHVTRMSSTAGARIRGQLVGRADVRIDLLELVGDGNKIYGNGGDGTFQELRFASGELSGGWAFGGGLADLDDDGWLDLYTPNGFRSGQSMCDT